MFNVGSSIDSLVNGSGFSKSTKVSPIWNASKPTTAQISPAWTSVTFFLPKPSKIYNSLTLPLRILPFSCARPIHWDSLIEPLVTLPTAILPKNEE